MSGAHEFDLPTNAKARMELEGSGLVFEVSAVNAGKAPPVGAFSSFEPAAYMFIGLSFLLHIGIVASMAFFMPKMNGDDSEAIDRDQLLLMQKMLNAAAEREQEEKKTEEVADNNADQKEGGTGTRAKGEEGSMGNPNTNAVNKRYGVQGPQDNPDPHIARQAALKEAQEFGMIGLINVGAGGDPNAPTAPWGREESSGNDPLSARGNMWGDAIGDAFGAGGLGLSGVGEGGGGRGEGIGLGNIGTLGHGAGTGTGQGFGNGHGRLGGAHQTKSAVASSGRDAGQRSPPAGSHPAHRSSELRSLPSLLRERSAHEPEPPGPRRGEVRHRPLGRRLDGLGRRLGSSGSGRRRLRRSRLRQPLVPAARRRHRHGRLPDHLQPRRLEGSRGRGARSDRRKRRGESRRRLASFRLSLESATSAAARAWTR